MCACVWMYKNVKWMQLVSFIFNLLLSLFCTRLSRGNSDQRDVSEMFTSSTSYRMDNYVIREDKFIIFNNNWIRDLYFLFYNNALILVLSSARV